MSASRAVTTDEVADAVQHLRSDKSKAREEGVKMVTSILESSAGLRVLDQQTAILGDKFITSWSWPGLLDALCCCIDAEIASNKKRGPKAGLAKVMRNLVQKAEDPCRPGKLLVLYRKVPTLAKHILYVLQEVPTFVSDYNSVLRQLLLTVEYRARLGKKTLSAFIELFFGKVKATVSGGGVESKEDGFQSTITLHSLLLSLPLDLANNVVDNFRGIFVQLSDEGRLLKKLLAALNNFILCNGLNLGNAMFQLHSSVRQFLFRTWLTTRDRELKDGLVFYIRAQLKLRHILCSGDDGMLDELLELVEKELDQTGIALAGMYREEKLGFTTRSMRCFLDLAATVIYEAHKQKAPITLDRAKRRRKVNVCDTVKDRLSNSKYLWLGAVCKIVRSYGLYLPKPILLCWLEVLASGFVRILSDGSSSRLAEASLWTVRCFQEFACIWWVISTPSPGKRYPVTSSEEENIWQSVWNSLLHWVPLLSSVPALMEEAFRLMGCLVAQNLVPTCSVPREFWNAHPFSELPSGGIIYFVVCNFSSPISQSCSREDIKLRSKLIDWTMSSLDIQDVSRTKGTGEDLISPRLVSAVILALTTGSLPDYLKCAYSVDGESISLLDELGHYLEPDVQERVDEDELSALDRSDDVRAASGDKSIQKVKYCSSSNRRPLPRSNCDFFLQQTADRLLRKVNAASEASQAALPRLFHMSATLSACIDGVEHILQKRGQELRDWCVGGRLWKALAALLEICASVIDGFGKSLCTQQQISIGGSNSANWSALSTLHKQPLQSMLKSLQQFTSLAGPSCLVDASGLCGQAELTSSQPLLEVLLRRLSETYLAFTGPSTRDQSHSEHGGQSKILDAELDIAIEGGSSYTDRLESTSGSLKGISGHIIVDRGAVAQNPWKLGMVQMISAVGQILPGSTVHNLADLLQKEQDLKMRWEMLRHIFQLITVSTLPTLTLMIQAMEDSLDEYPQESNRYELLDAIDVLFTKLLRPDAKLYGGQRLDDTRKACSFTLPQQDSLRISNLVARVAGSEMFCWQTRSKLAGVLATSILVDPTNAENLLDRLLCLLEDPEYRVRLSLSKNISVLFKTWEGHVELLEDISEKLKWPTVKASKCKVIVASELPVKERALIEIAETAITILGQLAAASSKVESEVVFRICVYAVSFPVHRPLVTAVLGLLATKLNYPTRWKYADQHLGGVLHRWVSTGMPLRFLLEVREILSVDLGAQDFLQQCCPWLLPSLLLDGRNDEIQWLSNATSETPSTLVKRHFPATFAALLLSHSSESLEDQQKATAVLQGSMLRTMGVTEDERDNLIKKNMVSIVSFLFLLCSSQDQSQKPYFSRVSLASGVRTVVDGFLDQHQVCQYGKIVDKMQVFRPDRVFMFLLRIHHQIQAACHPRHRWRSLSSLGALMDVIDHRCIVPSTLRYLVHIILQSISVADLQDQSCLLLSTLLDKIDGFQAEESTTVMGDQRQLIVSKLVLCCKHSFSSLPGKSDASSIVSNNESIKESGSPLELLHRLTTDVHKPLHSYIKDFDISPGLPGVETINLLQDDSGGGSTLAMELVQFVKRAPNLTAQLRMTSLQSLCQQLVSRKEELYERPTGDAEQSESRRCRPEVVAAVWKLLHLCNEQDEFDIRELVAEFLAVIGVTDTRATAFQLSAGFDGYKDLKIDLDIGVHESLAKLILFQLDGYITDSDVNVIELASRTIRGLLATEKGHRVFQSLDPRDTSYLKVWSGGVNTILVHDILSKSRSSPATPLDEYKIWDTSGNPYSVWVCRIVHSLIELTEDVTVRLCQEMVLRKAGLAELLFPHVLGLLAAKDDPNLTLCNQISEQVGSHIFCENNKSTRSIQLFLEAMNCLRLGYITMRLKQAPTTSKKRESLGSRKSGNLTHPSTDNISSNSQLVRIWKKVYWLQIDYLRTAKTAQQCAAYSTSALYVEHWCEETYGKLSLGEPDFSSDESLPLHIELLLTVCTKTSEPDCIYGVVRSHKLLSQLVMHENEGNWSKALEGYDLLLRSSKMNPSGATCSQTSVRGENQDWKYYKGLMRSLQQTGCSHVLAMYYLGLAQQKSSFLDNPEFKELQFEAAWRAGKWDLDCLPPGDGMADPHPRQESSYNANLYSSLRSLLEGDSEIFYARLKQSRQEIVSCIAYASMESTQNVIPDIVKLKILDCLSQAWELRWKRGLNFEEELGANQTRHSLVEPLAGPFNPCDEEMLKLEKVFQHNLREVRTHYNLAEHFSAFCKTLFGVIDRRDFIPRHLLEFACLSRKAKKLNHAAIYLHELKIICNELTKEVSPSSSENAVISDLVRTSSAGKVEEAKVLWTQGHQELALNLAKFACQNVEVTSDLADIYCLIGKWLSKTRFGSFRDILDVYLKQAVEFLAGSDDRQETSPNHALWMKRQCRTHYHLGHYTDALYRSYEERLSSTEWKAALRLRQHRSRELESLSKRLHVAAKGEQQQYLMKWHELQRQLALDSAEAEHLQEDKEYFLVTALQSYSTCLTTGNKYDLRVVFRLVSLWFSFSGNSKVVQEMQLAVQKVQSYKFLPLVYQIASRMGSSKETQGPHSFQSALTFLVKKMAVDHPYHSLYQLLALANGDRVKVQQRSRSAFVVDMDKKQTAENLLLQIQSHHPLLLQEIRRMVEIYIKLAELETKKEHMNKKVAVPREVRSVRQLELVPVITAHVPIDPGCNYSTNRIPFFQGFSDGITVMHGINAPKVLECWGSDGQKYRQLAKSGDDDLRQDAVMEQLFGLVNTLLQDDPDTRKRCLSIRTYKVVPFTPSAGVLEWVNGTIPLGEYLLGSGQRTGGAHGCYGEGDWPFNKCREKMATEKDKRKAFEIVCQNFRPVMHHFFMEKFSQPADWFEKRLAYTRSVATSSMVGYIVGLGDRHSMNILLDQASAEVVHIDLGVAFEQGLMLKTPERVPFRLTRDMVDGMGVSGVEGVFRRCCEATMSVMRMNKEALLTIIEVFIHDPLYKWALSPLKALQRQQELSDDEDESYLEEEDLPGELEGNKDAARALLRVKQKLDGYEGEMRSLEGQVQQLIQDAQDPERLCQMFPGWGAWV